MNIGGNLSAGGAVTIKLGGGPAGAVLGGNYQVLGYAGSLLGAGSNSFVLNATGAAGPTNFSPTLVYSGSAVDVQFNVSNYPMWSGTSSSSWDTTTTNWQSSSTSAATTFASNNFAYFGDYFNTAGGTVAIGTTTVSISAAVTPYEAYFANNTSAYTLTGTNGISGGAMLVMNGAGSLTINNTNTYTGGTYLYNGRLNLGTSAALGSTSGLTVAGGSIDNTSGGPMTLPQNYLMVWANGFTYVGSANPLNLGTGAVTLAGSTPSITLNVSANTLTVGGVISGPNGLTQTARARCCWAARIRSPATRLSAAAC